MLKRSFMSLSVAKFFNYALIAFKRQTHKASAFINLELSLTFCQSLARTQPEKPGPTTTQQRQSLISE